MNIENQITELNILKKELINHINNDNKQIEVQFENLINKLISISPTSELRNELTNLNILHIQTLINFNRLQTIQII